MSFLIKNFYLLAFAALLSVSAAYNYGTMASATVIVSEKERIVETDGDGGVSSKYLVFTDQGVFENQDTIFHFKFNSSDVYGELSAGDTFEISYYGWRVGLLSWYPNIIEVKKVN